MSGSAIERLEGMLASGTYGGAAITITADPVASTQHLPFRDLAAAFVEDLKEVIKIAKGPDSERTELKPVLNRELREGDRILWGSEVAEIAELGDWAGGRPADDFRVAAIRYETGTVHQGRRISRLGVTHMVLTEAPGR